MFNLRAIVKQIKNFYLLKYNSIINKIAVKSKAYKQLYNEVYYHKFIYENLDSFVETLKNLPSLKATLELADQHRLSSLTLADEEIIKISQSGDLIVCDSHTKAQHARLVLHGMQNKGKVVLLKDLKDNLNSNLGFILLPSTTWTKDLMTINNLVYTISKKKEEYKL